jgi:hypothetical protein
MDGFLGIIVLTGILFLVTGAAGYVLFGKWNNLARGIVFLLKYAVVENKNSGAKRMSGVLPKGPAPCFGQRRWKATRFRSGFPSTVALGFACEMPGVAMIHSVKLERLPDGLRFPAELAARVSYVSETRQLRFDGFMSKTDFDKLLHLSNDLSYQRALEKLFQECTFASPHSATSVNRKPVLLAGTSTVLAIFILAGLLVLRNRTAAHQDQPAMPPVAAPHPAASLPVSPVASEAGDQLTSKQEFPRP